MALYTYNPTSNTTPDPGQAGTIAVTSPTNTGHASSTAASTDAADSDSLSCIWASFPTLAGQRASVTLKMDHTSSGTLSGVGANNSFNLDYSVDNGSNWTNAVTRTHFTASQGPTTFSVALSVTQDLTLVKVRDTISSSTASNGESAACTATIANIKLEIQMLDGVLVAIM